MYRIQAEQGLDKLACQKSKEITINSHYRNQEKDEEQTDQQADHAVQKGQTCFAKMQYTFKDREIRER